MSSVAHYAKLVLLTPQQFVYHAMKDTTNQETPVSVALTAAERAVQQHQTAYHAKSVSHKLELLGVTNVLLVISNIVINVTLISLNAKNADSVMFSVHLQQNVLNASLDALTASLIKFSNVKAALTDLKL